MALIDKEIIRAEIKRLESLHSPIPFGDDYEVGCSDGYQDCCDNILSFLDTLPEQPVIKKSNALFDECVKNCDPAVMKEVSDNIDKMLGRQPVEGLEEEIDRLWESFSEEMSGPHNLFDMYRRLARHFAEWQKKQDQETIELAEDHAMLAGMNKMEQQMMEKAYDTVMQFDELDDLVPTFEDMQKFGFKVGDKVKVIILKEK